MSVLKGLASLKYTKNICIDMYFIICLHLSSSPGASRRDAVVHGEGCLDVSLHLMDL